MDDNSYNFIKRRSIKKYKPPLTQAQNALNSTTMAPFSQFINNDQSISNLQKIIQSIKRAKPTFSPAVIANDQFSKIKQIRINKQKRRLISKKYPETQLENTNKILDFSLTENNCMFQQDKQSHKNYHKSKEEIAIQNLYKFSIAQSDFPSTFEGKLTGWTNEFPCENSKFSYKKNQDKFNQSSILESKKRKSPSIKKEKRISHLNLFDFKQNIQTDCLLKCQDSQKIITQVQPQIFIKRQHYSYYKSNLGRKHRKKPLSLCRTPCQQQHKNTSNIAGNNKFLRLSYD